MDVFPYSCNTWIVPWCICREQKSCNMLWCNWPATPPLAGSDVKKPLEAWIVFTLYLLFARHCAIVMRCGLCQAIWCRDGMRGGRGGRGCPCLGNSPCSIIPMETSGWSMPRQPNLIFHFVFLFICFSTSNDQNVYTIPPQLNSWRSVTRNPDPGYRQPLHWCWVDKPACLIIRLFLEFASDSVFVKLKLNGNAVSCVRRQGKLWNAHIFFESCDQDLLDVLHMGWEGDSCTMDGFMIFG